MATTIAVFTALEADTPSSAYAYLAVRSTGVSVLQFAHSSTNSAIFKSLIPAGITIASMIVTIWWSDNGATSGAAVWGVDIDNTTSHSIDTDSFGTQSTATTTVSGTANKPNSTVITVTTGNQQSLTAEQPYKLRVQRLGANGSDTLTDIGSLYMVEVAM